MPYQLNRLTDSAPPPPDAASGGLIWLTLLFGVAIGYAMFARLGLALIPSPEHVALFWPASGLASGVLIAVGSKARVPVSLGVAAATIAANITTRSDVGVTLVFAASNAIECLLVAALFQRLAGSAAPFEHLNSVIAFIVSAIVGAAVAAFPAAVALKFFELSSASLLQLWLVWFKSDAVGIVTVAPLLITSQSLWRKPVNGWKIAEGITAVALTGLATFYTFSMPPTDPTWSVIAPATLLFPLMLWLASRTKPVFSAAAIFVFALIVTWAAMRGLGRFGDPSIAQANRILAGQLAMLTLSLCGLALAAILTNLGNVAEALQTSEKRLRLGLNAGGVYAFDFDTATRRGHRFGNLIERLGLPAEGNLQDYHERLHPDDTARFQTLMRSLSPTAPSFSEHLRLRALDGHYLVVAHRTEATFDEHGRLSRIVGTTTDITRQSRIEQALRDSEERLRLGLNAGGVYAFDFDFCEQRVHRFGGLIDRLGLPPVGRMGDYEQVLHPDDRERFSAMIEATSVDAPYFTDRFRLRALDGSYLFVVHRAEVRFDDNGNITRIVGTCADVTKRHFAEVALQESEARLRKALHMGRVFAFDWEASTGVGRRSDNAAEILGVSERQSQMSRAQFGKFVHPDDIARLTANTAALTADNPIMNSEFRFIRPDKRMVWLEVTQGGTFDEQGRLLRVSGLTRDVTERKRLIDELNHRVKNTLEKMRAVIKSSLEGHSTLEDYVKALTGRIEAMARTHNRLSETKWAGVDLAVLVLGELEPFRTGANTIVEGPEFVLAAGAAQSMAMTLHELATNAAKYGALSRPTGRVEVRWRVIAQPPDDAVVEGPVRQILRLEWLERTDWDIDTSPRSGFGTTTIRHQLSFELQAQVSFKFTARGLTCTIDVPIERAAAPLATASPDATAHAVNQLAEVSG